VAATDGTPVTTNNNNADADDDDDCSGEFEVMLAASYQKRGISIWQRGSGLLKGAVLVATAAAAVSVVPMYV